MRDSEIVIELNRLIKINKEAIQSLVTALNKIRSEDLFNHFNSQAEERQVFVDQLSVKLRAYYPNEKVNDAECTSIKLYPNLHELKGSLPDEIVLAKFTQAEKYAIEKATELFRKQKGLLDDKVFDQVKPQIPFVGQFLQKKLTD